MTTPLTLRQLLTVYFADHPAADSGLQVDALLTEPAPTDDERVGSAYRSYIYRLAERHHVDTDRLAEAVRYGLVMHRLRQPAGRPVVFICFAPANESEEPS